MLKKLPYAVFKANLLLISVYW